MLSNDVFNSRSLCLLKSLQTRQILMASNYAMIPIGEALVASGVTNVIGEEIVAIGQAYSLW